MYSLHKFKTYDCLFFETRSEQELAARRQYLNQKRKDHTGKRTRALAAIADLLIAAGNGLQSKLNQNAGLNA